MKKLLIIALAAFSVNLLAQPTMQIRYVQKGNALVAPNDILYQLTSPNHDTYFDLDVTNTGSVTNTYTVKRYDMILNTDAEAYFCFGGNCYTSGTYISPNPLTLSPGQSASSIQGMYNLLTVDLIEGPAVGISQVKYTFYNTSVVADSMQITVKYNVAEPTGIKETAKILSSFEIFPNPAKETTSIRVNSPKAMESSLILYNTIGEAVYRKDVSIAEGKNKIDLNLENLPTGVYFASLKTGNATISKKLIIN